MFECDGCGNLMPMREQEELAEDDDELQCSQCGVSFASKPPRQVTVYRLCVTPVVSDRPRQAAPVAVPASAAELDEELDPEFLTDVFRHTPLLRYYSRNPDLQTARPFAGKRVLTVLHFLRDLIPFMEALFTLGAEPASTALFYKAYPYPQRRAVAEYLKDRGCTVLPAAQIQSFLGELTRLSSEDLGEILAIEDGGFIVPLLHRQFRGLLACAVGAVEQTTRGIRNIRALEGDGKPIAIPVMSVAASKLKGDFEPPHVAQAVISNVTRLVPHMALRGKHVGLLGFGTIGQQLFQSLRDAGAVVTVYDRSKENQLCAHQSGANLAQTAADAARDRHFVIGASGEQSVDSSVIAVLRHNTYLVSASSEQYEIDLDELSRVSHSQCDLLGETRRIIGTGYVLTPDKRQINLLANGYPVNFWGMDSMPEQASDLILTLILLSAAEVAGRTHLTPGISDEAVNELAGEKRYNVAGKFLEFHP